MNGWSDVPNVMRGSTLDEDTIERLLCARIAPDDAPPGYSEVARLVRIVAETPGPSDPAVEERHIAAALAVIRRESAAGARADRPQRKRSWRRRARVAGVVLAGALVGSTGLAFAGALPDPAQDAVADVLDRVGITVPAGHDAPEPTDRPASTGKEISDIATSTESSGVDKGAEISSTASGDRSRAGQEGGGAAAPGDVPGDVPPVETPNVGGTQTADAASGSAGEVGTDRADERNDGRSAAGSSSASNAAPASPAG
jgi:hypothetical protein